MLDILSKGHLLFEAKIFPEKFFCDAYFRGVTF